MMAQKFIVPLLLRILPAIRPEIAWRPWTSHKIINMPPGIWSTRHYLFRIKPSISLCKPSSGSSLSSGASRLATLYIVKRNIDPQLLPNAEKVAPCLKLSLYDWPINLQFFKTLCNIMLRTIVHRYGDRRSISLTRLTHRLYDVCDLG